MCPRLKFQAMRSHGLVPRSQSPCPSRVPVVPPLRPHSLPPVLLLLFVVLFVEVLLPLLPPVRPPSAYRGYGEGEGGWRTRSRPPSARCAPGSAVPCARLPRAAPARILLLIRGIFLLYSSLFLLWSCTGETGRELAKGSSRRMESHELQLDAQMMGRELTKEAHEVVDAGSLLELDAYGATDDKGSSSRRMQSHKLQRDA